MEAGRRLQHDARHRALPVLSVLQGVGDTLYFSRNVDDSFINGIYRYKAGDSAPTQLVPAENVISMLVDGDYVYYVLQNVAGLWRSPIAGGAGVELSDVSANRVIGADADFVYVASSGCCSTNLFKVVK